MKPKSSWLGMLLAVALLVSACGAVTPTPDTVLDNDQGTMETSAAMASRDDASTSMGEDERMLNDEADTGEGDASMANDDMMEGEDQDKDGDTSASNDDDMMAGEAEASGQGDMDGDAMDKEAMMDHPVWFGAELVDVSSGETLTVAGLKDKVVLVETMAIWCSNCLRQQQEVKALHEVLGERDDLVTLVLDVDPNEDAGNLRDYAAKHGFTWNYAVAPREVAREIGQLYGDQFLNPPSTPMLIIDQHGEVHLLPFGRKTAGDLQDALAPFLSEEM